MGKIIDFKNIRKSCHSQTRAQQRAIRDEVLDTILSYSDKIEHCGNGCMRRLITRRKIGSLVIKKIIKPSQAEKLKNITVITKENNIISVFHAYKKFRR